MDHSSVSLASEFICRSRAGSQRLCMGGVTTVPADALAPDGAWPPAGTMMTTQLGMSSSEYHGLS